MMEHIGDVLRRQPGADVLQGSAVTPEDEADEPTCPRCHGARFVHPLLATGQPDYSSVVPCRCTGDDAEGQRQSRLQRHSNLGPLARLTFDNLSPSGLSERPSERRQFARALEAARAFADAPQGWLVLTGPSSRGKTHLAAAIANQCVANERPVFYVSTPDLLDHLRASFGPTSDVPYDEYFEQVRNTPLLILDDLGAQSSTAWATEKLEQLLNHRFTNRLPSVIIPIVPLEGLDDRVRARLTDPDLSRVHSLGNQPSALLTSDWGPGFELQRRMTFDSFDSKRANLPLEQRQNLDMAYRRAVDFAESPDGWLIFQGVNGCGKTHLAAAIVNYRFQHGHPALFVVVPDFLDHLRSAFSPDSKLSYDQLFDAVRTTPLLVLDDFGQQSTTPWAREKLYQVINHRYNARLAMAVTTNCTTDEMDPHISSRFIDQRLSTLFHITAPNYFSGSARRPPRGSSGNR